MTFLVEHLADLRKHLDHLHAIRPRVIDARQLQEDLSRNVLIHEYVRLDYERVIAGSQIRLGHPRCHELPRPPRRGA